MPRDIRIVDSITQPDDATGSVVLAGSHGGISSARYAAKVGVSGVVFNDAGVGTDGAGIESLPYLDGFGCPAATVDYRSCRIADGVDMARHGTISHINDAAEEVGCTEGQDALDCAATMHDAGRRPEFGDAETELFETVLSEGTPSVWGVDSIGLIDEEHEGAVTIAGSHGERLAGESETYVPTAVAGITLFDAGVGKDDAGIGRLETMDERGIPAAAVDVHTARIGDAESAWETGVLSHVNDSAAALGIVPGDTTQGFASKVRSERSGE